MTFDFGKNYYVHPLMCRSASNQRQWPKPGPSVTKVIMSDWPRQAAVALCRGRRQAGPVWPLADGGCVRALPVIGVVSPYKQPFHTPPHRCPQMTRPGWFSRRRVRGFGFCESEGNLTCGQLRMGVHRVCRAGPQRLGRVRCPQGLGRGQKQHRNGARGPPLSVPAQWDRGHSLVLKPGTRVHLDFNKEEIL